MSAVKQKSLSDGFDKYHKKMRKNRFLHTMDILIPWQGWCEAIEAFYSSPHRTGRRSNLTERMLRIHFLQYWFNSPDPAAEEALYHFHALHHIVGIDHCE